LGEFVGGGVFIIATNIVVNTVFMIIVVNTTSDIVVNTTSDIVVIVVISYSRLFIVISLAFILLERAD